MQPFLKYTFAGILIYATYCLMLLVMQRMILFPRTFAQISTGAQPDTEGVERIWISTEAGDVEAWFMPPAGTKGGAPAPLVIFAHGNGELIDHWPGVLKPFTRLGASVLLVEYPGYGRSAGKPSQRSITEVFIKAYDRISRRQGVDPSKIVFVGRSLGGGAVCALAKHRPSAALILMSTFTSVRSFAPRYLAPKFLVLDPFDNLAVVETYDNPILILHGTGDDIIPYEHGRKLFEASRRAEMIAYDAGHNDFPPDWDRFWKDAGAFLEKAGVLRTPETGFPGGIKFDIKEQSSL